MRFLLLILLFPVLAFGKLTDRELAVLFIDSEPMDYYEYFGVSRSASIDEIKKAYRKLASRYHTGRPGQGDHEKFIRAARAWEVLSDPQRKVFYDNWLSGQTKTSPIIEKTDSTKTYKKWEPPQYEANEPVYRDPRKKRRSANNTQDFASEAEEGAESTWKPKPSGAPIYSKKPETKTEIFGDSISKISPKFLFEGGFPNYFAAASVSIHSSPGEIKNTIEWKKKKILAILAEKDLSSTEKSAWENRFRRLIKAEEILLNPQLREEYLFEAGKVRMKDIHTGRIYSFADRLRSFKPEYRPAGNETGAGARDCSRWYSKMFSIFK